MNKLEELHLQVIQDCTIENYYPEYSSDISESLLITKSAEITEQIAIEFADWIADNWSPNGRLGCWDSKELTSSRESKYLIDSTKQLFQEFLKQR